MEEAKKQKLERLLAAVLEDDRAMVGTLLQTDKYLVSDRVSEARFYEVQIFHWLYVGDTALHFAAAGYRVEIVQQLVAAGADRNAAMNHRRSSPLHYAADGYIIGPAWNPQRQVATLQCLIEAGAQVNAQDKNGATALHRAVRTRCADATRFLLERGADAIRANKSGSTPFHLAVQDTGRGGAGTDEARTAQREIIQHFLARGVSVALKDGKGKSVLDCAKSAWVRELLLSNSQRTLTNYQA